MKTHILAACLASAMLPIASLQAAGPQKAASEVTTPAALPHKVVIQVSDGDPKKWSLALNNARNVQTDLGAGNVDIEIVAYGPGIGMLLSEAELASRVEQAASSGVRIVACENTMTNQKLSREQMNMSVGYVPAGVVEIMKRQAEGYAYIRP